MKSARSLTHPEALSPDGSNPSSFAATDACAIVDCGDVTHQGLSEDHEFLCALLDHASDGIYFKDKDSKYLRCSEAKLKRHGLTAQEIVGKSDFDFFSEKHARGAFNDEQEIIRTGNGIVGKVEHEIMKDGEERWALSSKWPLRDRRGEIIGTFGISKNITELKKAEAELARANKKLIDASRLAGMAEVATAVLHNVGNVLNSVNVSASVIGESLRKSKSKSLAKVAELLHANAADLPGFFTNDDKGRQLPAYIASLAEHMAAEENKLREEFASLSANIGHIKEIVSTQQNYAKTSGVPEELAPADLVEDALRLNAGACQRHHIDIVRDFEPTQPVFIDKHKTLQILVNLIANAKNALSECSHPQKCIVIRIRTAGKGAVRISVIDNGIGILPENLTRIFNHGFTTRKDGHGFGLHSGALDARQLGGSLTCESPGPGKGATFTLELPVPSKHNPIDSRN
jgi:PAS domain S-box-containing protein